jgi:hypothetical protein
MAKVSDTYDTYAAAHAVFAIVLFIVPEVHPTHRSMRDPQSVMMPV